MAKTEKKEETLVLEPVKKTLIRATLVGASDLILCKKARSYEKVEVFKQSNPKGTKIPNELNQGYFLWEKIITSVHWRDRIEYHDDDWSKYTEEEWRKYCNDNAPLIPSQAIFGSMYESFVSFGFKDSTGKNGTDVKRGVSFARQFFPITFADASIVQQLIPNNSASHTNVLGQHAVFSGWECKIELTVADVAFPANTIIELLTTAGQFIGLSTQRKNGYGRFTVEHIAMEHID